MAVVINEFEVVDTPAAAAPPPAPTAEEEALPAPEDLERLLRVASERRLRVLAH